MKAFKVIAGVVIAAVAVVAVNTASVGATGNHNQECKFEYKAFSGQPYGLGQGFEKHPDVVTTGFWISGDETCRMDVTLTVWKIPHATLQPYPEEEQVYFAHKTGKQLKPGFHVLAVKVPDCFWQADLVKGVNPTGPNGKLPYEDGRMINSTLGGDKKCVEEPETPKTPEQPKGQGEVQSVQTPAVLPSTGAGAVAGIFAGVTASAGAAHAAVRRYLRK